MLVQRIKQFFGGSSTRKKSSLNDFYGSLYPESVRYALAHNEARLGKQEIRALVDRFTFEAVYLATKALAYSTSKQRFFLEGLTQIYYETDYHLDDVRHFLYPQIEALPDDTQLAGTKLLQLSRAGSDHWQAAFQELAERCYREESQALPCIVAYTPMLGYHHFIRAFSRESLGKLQLLIPDWMLDPDNERMGYEITLGTHATVRSQEKDDCLFGSWVCLHTDCPMKHRFCQDAIFIDDTINTGATSSKLRSFWKSEYGMNVPHDRVRVITDLRNSATNEPQLNEVARKDSDNASDERNRSV